MSRTPATCRGAQHDVAHSGNLRRHGAHQDAARVRSSASRHIDANTFKRSDDLTDEAATGFLVPGSSKLAYVERTDAFGCAAQCSADIVGGAFAPIVPLVASYGKHRKVR